MLTRIRKLLAPPIFEGNEDQTRAAEILNTILWAILAGAMLASPLILIASSERVTESRLIATATLVLLTLALLALLRRGYLALASATLIIGIWVIITLAIVFGGGGVRSLGFPGHIILVLIAGILLGRRAAIATAGLSVLTGLAFVYARSIGAVSNPPVPDTDQEIWVIQSVYLGSAALLLGMALRSIERAFARARQELAERKQTEEALQRSKIELEEHNASLRIINEIAAKLHRSLDVQQIAAEAVDSLVHYSQSPMVAFFLLDKPESRLKVLAQYGFNSATLAVGSSLPLRGSLSGLVVQSKSVTASEDIREDDRLEPAVRQALLSQGLHSGVSIPILFQEEVLGVVNLIFAGKYVMSDYQRDTLISIGKTIGLAVANARHVAQIESEITERQRAEEELQASEARFRALIENSRDIITVLDSDGTIRYASPSVKRIMGYALDEFVGRNVFGFLHQEDVSRVTQEWMRARHNLPSAPSVTEARVRHADGSWHVHEAVGTNLLDNPAVKGFVMNSRDITERKRAEEQLQSSEHRFRNLSQAAFEGIMIHEGGVILDANTAFANLFGYPDVEDLIGKKGVEVLPFSPESREKIRQEMLLETSQPFEVQVVRPDGTTFPAETQGREVVYRGRRERVVAMRDITERKRAEEQIRRQAVEMTALYETTHDLVIEQDLSKLLRTIVERAAALLGASGGGLYLCDAEQRQVRCVVSYNIAPYDYVGVILNYGEGAAGIVAETGEPLIIDDYRAWTGRATIYEQDQPFVSVLSVPMRWQEHVIGVLHILENARPRAFTQEDLRVVTLFANQAAVAVENAQLFDQARRRADEFAALYDTARELADTQHVSSLLQVIVNRAAALFAAPSAAIFLHDPVRHDLELACSLGPQLPVGARLAWGEGLAGRAAQTRRPLMVDDYHAWPDRSPQFEAIPFSGDLQVPMLYHGELIGVLGVSDIGPTTRRFTEADARLLSLFAAQAASTVHDARLLDSLEQRVAERTRELAEANERLTELDRLKSKFVSDVSHELRTPVTNLNLYLNLLERGKLEKRAEYMSVLRQQAARLTQLIEDILDLSRLEEGVTQAKFESLDLHELAAQVVAALRPGAEAKGLTFHFDPEENLPTIRGVANQLTRVITNLVANAINYTRVGVVTVSTRAEQDRVLLQVQDTGMGIDQEDLPHLFERFYRGRRTAQSTTSGTGLGLAIAKEIIEAHGGQIEVESQLGQGSIFRVWLPITPTRP